MYSDSNKRTSSDGSKQNKECVRHQRKPYTGTPQTQKDRSNAGTGYLLKTMDRLRLHINPHSSTLGHHQSVSCHHQNGKQDHLKSITEKSSSKEHVLTPSSKHSSGINKGQVLSYKGQVLSYKEQVLPYKDYRDTDRTSKKIGMLEYERNQLGCSLQRVDTQTKKMIVNSLKEPEKFQRILSDQILSVSYRVIRYRLIEI